MSDGFFDRLFGKRKVMAEPRLSAAEAERIARNAAGDSYLVDLLVMQGPEESNGRVVWHLVTPTRGAMLSVLVDDATGAAEVSRHPGR